MEQELQGLSAREVEEQKSRGEGEDSPERITKTKGQIIRENTCTRFNALNFILAGLLFAVGAYSNMLFISIIIVNILVGIAQELKAKKLVDELSVLNRSMVCVRRDGKDQMIEREDIVRRDLLLLKSGDQICSDSIVVSGSMEVNESLLTGESDAVSKEEGDQLYSGSFVTAGRAAARVIHVGDENYASGLVKSVKKEKQVHSELMGSMKKITQLTSFLIVPLGVILFLEALVLRGTPADEAVISSAAALLGMLPKGLVLLISVSLASGVIRLAKMKILVQNIYSLESLAHVDTLCLDKTGTITDGTLRVYRTIPMMSMGQGEAKELMGAYTEACSDSNPTFLALKQAFPPKKAYEPVHQIPFSSKRKWSSISFDGVGTVFVGAPEKLMGKLEENLVQEMEQGRRLLAAGFTPEIWKDEENLPPRLQIFFAIVLEERLRRSAGETLEFFRKEGVEVKVISGDHVKTVSAIARRAGLEKWKNAVDLSKYPEMADYEALCEQYTVFGRTTPKQKEELVKALKRKGHQVAMTGDGVNDLLALREADCSIAVSDGSDASRQLAQIVLLDSDFTHLPQVVMEGRRVVSNVTRTAGVFFIKTIYSILVSIFCLVSNTPFPFIPIQITLVDACIEAYPSFLTILEADRRKITKKFLKTAASNALPFGLSVTGMIMAVSLQAPFSEPQRQTVMYLALILISMTAVVKSCYPFQLLRSLICVTMAAGTFGALMILPNLFHVSPILPEMALYLAAVMAAAWGFLALYFFVSSKLRHSEPYAVLKNG